MSLLVSLSEHWSLPDLLAKELGIKKAALDYGRYPDGESRFRLLDDVRGQNILLLANLHHPDERVLPVLLLADTLRDLGAARVDLLVPYLPYMRQDKRFQPGEGVTSRYFASLISRHFDSLTTIDPHLHRYHSLDEIYAIPGRVLQAATLLSAWVTEHVQKPLLIGPDAESEQWVSGVARAAKAPFVIATKTRHGDRSVEVKLPDISAWQDHLPVLVDDIISSVRTMMEAIRVLRQQGHEKVICLGVHGVFAEQDYQALAKEAAQIITTDAIPHATNGISVATLLAQALQSQPLVSG